MAIRYAEDKPKSCEYCYFWNEKKKECRQMRCFISSLKSHLIQIRHTGFGFHAKAVRMEEIPVLAIAWLKF